MNQDGSYFCICEPGYSGVHCESGKQRMAVTMAMDTSNGNFHCVFNFNAYFVIL